MRIPSRVRYAAGAAVAIVLGTGIYAHAAPGGMIGSIFYQPVVNGAATTPCSTTQNPNPTTTCNAVVDSQGQLAVSDAATHGVLNHLTFDNGALQVTNSGTSTITGDVNVVNQPTVNAQQSGSWTVALAPGTTVKLDGQSSSTSADQTRIVTNGQFSTSTTLRLPSFDVTGAKELRVTVVGAGCSGPDFNCPPMHVDIDVPATNGLGTQVLIPIDGFDVGVTGSVSRVYDAPGTSVTIVLGNSDSRYSLSSFVVAAVRAN
jgi:hypothetical protein